MPGLDKYAWYPTGVPNDLAVSPYGPPNPETLALFGELAPGSRILDVAGGYGRYAVPLAKAGYDVTIADIDRPHLDEAARRAAELPTGSGQISTVEVDIVKESIPDAPYQAALCAGFLYLAPRGIARAVTYKVADALEPEGQLVIEFATNRDRRSADGRSLMGPGEVNYTEEEGDRLLRRLFQETGVRLGGLTRKIIHFEEPYYLHTDLLIASGTKVG